MSRPRKPQPAKLVIGLLMNDKELFSPVTRDLEKAYGATDVISPWMDFDYTDYYAVEMGSPLCRRMLAFRRLIAQTALATIKRQTNAIEKKYSHGGKRRINLDPGYLLYERFVLATGKNYSHRIYIGEEIYADLTLIFQQGAYQPLPWTYPDYKSGEMGTFLMDARQKYSENVKTNQTENRE